MNFSLAQFFFQVASFVSTRNLFQHGAAQQLLVSAVLAIVTAVLFWKVVRHVVRYTFISVAWILAVYFISEFTRSDLAKPYIALAETFLLSTLNAWDQLVIEFQAHGGSSGSGSAGAA